MSGALVHPYVADEQAAGYAQAEEFLVRLTNEPCAVDDLVQAISLARFGSVERQRAFCARIQRALIEGARDAG